MKSCKILGVLIVCLAIGTGFVCAEDYTHSGCLKIGDNHAGGIIFYLDGSGRGLVAAPEDQGEYEWKEAKKACEELSLNGYDDWFLPSKDELNLMYENLHKKGLGGFTDYNYWSSSESNNNGVWFQRFESGNQDFSVKYGYYMVRAVRAF